MKDARSGIEAVKPRLENTIINDQSYWYTPVTPDGNADSIAYLLPSYDEYTVGYKDRSTIYDGSHAEKLSAFRESILTQTILLEGEISGTWKRTIKKKEVVVEVAPFTLLIRSQTQQVIAAAQRYGKFLELPVMLDV